MRQFVSSVSPKGQITLPVEIRDCLGIKTKDKVSITLEGDSIKVEPMNSQLAASYMAVPPLKPPRTLKQMREIAREEHAQHVAKEGL